MTDVSGTTVRRPGRTAPSTRGGSSRRRTNGKSIHVTNRKIAELRASTTYEHTINAHAERSEGYAFPSIRFVLASSPLRVRRCLIVVRRTETHPPPGTRVPRKPNETRGGKSRMIYVPTALRR